MFLKMKEVVEAIIIIAEMDRSIFLNNATMGIQFPATDAVILVQLKFPVPEEVVAHLQFVEIPFSSLVNSVMMETLPVVMDAVLYA
jgi:hypothetical protein